MIMSRMDYEIIKRVYTYAIFIDLSDEELSFLMGKRNKYFFDLLDPTDKDKLKTEQLDILPTILGVPIRNLVPNDVKAAEDVVIHSSKKVSTVKLTYKHYVVFADGTRSENITWTKKFVKGVRKKLNLELHGAVLKLLNNGYFDQRRSALELFIKLRSEALIFKAAELQKSLAVLMNKKRNQQVLLKCETKNSRLVYLKTNT